MNHRLTFSSILKEVPLKSVTNAHLRAFLGSLADSHKAAGLSGTVGSNAAGLEPSFSVLGALPG